MLTFDPTCDADNVEDLVGAATEAMSTQATFTTPEEVISATFTLLDRTLRAVRRLQTPEERFQNAIQIRKLLQDMIADHGHVPS